MDWLKDLVGKKGTQVKRNPPSVKKTSNERRFHVRNSDKKILIAHKNPTGNGYVYKTKGPNGTRNVHIQGNLYKTEEDAKKKSLKLKNKA